MSMISNVTNPKGRIIPQTNLMLNFRFWILHPVWKILLPVQKILMTSGFEDQILLWSRWQKHKVFDKCTKEIYRSEIKLDYIFCSIFWISAFYFPFRCGKFYFRFRKFKRNPISRIKYHSGVNGRNIKFFTKEIYRSEIKLECIFCSIFWISTYYFCFRCKKFKW